MNNKEYWIIINSIRGLDKKIDAIIEMNKINSEKKGKKKAVNNPVDKMFINGLGEIPIETKKQYIPIEPELWKTKENKAEK